MSLRYPLSNNLLNEDNIKDLAVSSSLYLLVTLLRTLEAKSLLLVRNSYSSPLTGKVHSIELLLKLSLTLSMMSWFSCSSLSDNFSLESAFLQDQQSRHLMQR